MFEFMMMRIMMEEVSDFLDEIIVDIQEGELEGLQARIVVDDVMEKAYGTRKEILAIIEHEGNRGMTEEELETSIEFVNWAGEIITKCKLADELLGDVEVDFVTDKDIEDNHIDFGFSMDEEEDEKDCDNCDVRGLCEIFNKMDLFK